MVCRAGGCSLVALLCSALLACPRFYFLPTSWASLLFVHPSDACAVLGSSSSTTRRLAENERGFFVAVDTGRGRRDLGRRGRAGGEKARTSCGFAGWRWICNLSALFLTPRPPVSGVCVRARRAGRSAMLRRMVPDPVPDSSGSGGGGDARPRVGVGSGAALFAVPRLFVGFAAKRAAPDAESSSRSPTSPLDPKALLLRSPRSPRMTWGAPGLVDALASDTAAANCLLSPRLRLIRPHSSPPKDCGGPGGGGGGGGHSQPELGKTMSCPAPDTSAAGVMSVPCSRFQFHRHGDLKSGPEATRSESNAGAHHLVISNASKRHSFDLGKLPGPGSLPASASRRFVCSVSASEIEESEDYTRIIARGPNPKTTHIFGDCILEPRTVGGGDDGVAAMESEEGAAGCCYFVVKCAAEAAAGADDFLSSCFACKKKLEGNDIYIYRGEKAFCSANCRDQEIQLEEEAENNNTGSVSPLSSCSSFHDDIFMAGMVVAT